ncbi:MAG: alanine racemase [Anaerolineaceae bacterium]|nr:alanine racemase [Anaerolineaceae bacterium]
MFDELVSWAEVDLDAFAANLRTIRRHIGPHVEIIAVIKANAYGHGATPLAPVALQAGASRLAVHRAIEGIELRQAGIQAPILLLGYTPPVAAGEIVRWRLTPSVITPEFAQALSSAATTQGVSIPIHVKVDTGMNRYGIMPEETVEFVCALNTLPGLLLEGIFTHFGVADAADPVHSRRQLAIFTEVLGAIRQAGVTIPLVHAANSAAIMRMPEAHFNAVRPGISLYGLNPSVEWAPPFELRPVLTLKSRVARLHDLPAGAAVGYGRTYLAPQPGRAALVITGYGDGYHRVLSNRASVLVGGRRAAVIGRVSMDQIVVDVTGIPGVRQDDEVVLIGRQGDERIRAEEVAELAGTINYEVTTALLPRVTRIYLQDGVEVSRVGLGAA